MSFGSQPATNQGTDSSFPPGRPPDGLFLRLVKGWIWLSALAGLAGWSLSAIGQLNRTGYALFFAAAAGAWLACRRRWDWSRPDWPKTLRRFRRPLPVAFAALAFLIFLGGAIYPPSNYDGLAYRVARVLHWLDHGHWWWIHTPEYRMNDRTCGIEWFYAPLLLFTKSDRALFLVNYIPFLLLPGLVFSVFTRLGVRARVAWSWMWLLPAGYNFLLQAGSIANDTFPDRVRARRSGFRAACLEFPARFGPVVFDRGGGAAHRRQGGQPALAPAVGGGGPRAAALAEAAAARRRSWCCCWPPWFPSFPPPCSTRSIVAIGRGRSWKPRT